MSDQLICSECGAVIPSDAKLGLCARCLLNLGLQAGQPDPLEPEENASDEALSYGAKRGSKGLVVWITGKALRFDESFMREIVRVEMEIVEEK
jgi:hypothetical protein